MYRFVRTAIVLLLAVFLMMGCTTQTHTPRPIPRTDNKAGIHLLLDDGRLHWPVEQWPEHVEAAADLIGEGGHVVQLIRLDDLDVAKWQTFMDLCAENSLIPIIRLATTFDREANVWTVPPADRNGGYDDIATTFTDFLMALDWPGDVRYIIVGNEPNHGNEWGGQPDPAAYARYLIDVATALHNIDESFRVMNAPLDQFSPHTNGQPFVDGMIYIDAESFMDGMVTAEPDVFTHLDAWASHPYPLGPFRDPPTESIYQIDMLNGAVNPVHVEPPPGIHNRGIRGYEWELFKLGTYGIEGLPIFITETGWRHQEAVDPNSLDGADNYPEAAMVQRYMEAALCGDGDVPGWVDDDQVVAVVFFALDGHPAEWSHTNWLLIDQDGDISGAYYQAMDCE